jgi:hypothetical protein
MSIENQESLICEALVREIGAASRWCAVVEAWEALLHVRIMAKNMKAEFKHLNPDSGGPCEANRNS